MMHPDRNTHKTQGKALARATLPAQVELAGEDELVDLAQGFHIRAYYFPPRPAQQARGLLPHEGGIQQVQAPAWALVVASRWPVTGSCSTGSKCGERRGRDATQQRQVDTACVGCGPRSRECCGFRAVVAHLDHLEFFCCRNLRHLCLQTAGGRAWNRATSSALEAARA